MRSRLNSGSGSFLQLDSMLLMSAAILAIPFLLVGCSHIIQRAQSPDAEAMDFGDDFEEPVYVGDICAPSGLNKQKVDGIALVTQLDGTGSEPPASGQRDYLVREIQTHKIDDINGLLAGDDNSMVLIMGMIPPGARKGDQFDLQVQCLERSRTSSLEGGFLMRARMKPFIQTHRAVEFGHNQAVARGRVLIDNIFEPGDEVANKVSGIIPGGGTVTRDRECGLQIQHTDRSIRNATAISRAVNRRFSTHIQGSPEGVANPVSDNFIEMLIPEGYSHNVGRYFHVILNVVFDESPDQLVNRMERLERELHNPETASLTAIRLEAIGEDASNILKRGLRNHDLRVQFHAAQALAYMGDPAGVSVLQKAADTEPAFRWHALKALASVRDSSSENALAALFNSESTEARYGAFQTLRESQPDSLIVDGENVGNEFMLHTVSSDERPMIHLSRSSVPEVVIFGGDQHFNARLLFIESGLTVKYQGPSTVLIKRYLPNGASRELECSTLVADVLRKMTSLGADYGDVIKLLKDARETEAIQSQLVINAVPQLVNSYRVAGNPSDSHGGMDGQYVSGVPGDESDSSNTAPESGKGIFRKFW